ncbi:hypothetical protein EG68_09829 [Paragonimus skrjabini miyazakii]|uniref:ethanolamine kinase n=1 Tax=Paragonimus skrjabini miyazakii TaxID=59628 RepID=A0A8S9YR37_9TREM|nr:hypothetical protein EG68_09829 [Paragonimus skrjabini miyazakii]
MKFSSFVYGLVNCIDLTITGPNDECGVRELLNHIFPQKVHDHIQLQILDNGLSNQLILVSCCQPQFEEPFKLLVRIYGQITNTLVDRTMELLCMHALYEFRRRPQVHAVFSNGIAYSYIAGSTIPVSSLSSKKYRRSAGNWIHLMCLYIISVFWLATIVTYKRRHFSGSFIGRH